MSKTTVTITFAEDVPRGEVEEWFRDFDQDLHRPPYTEWRMESGPRTAHERYVEASRNAQARWTILQALVDDIRCPFPGQYLADCGKCAVCAMRYSDGAAEYVEKFSEHNEYSVVPGSREMALMRDEIRSELAQAPRRNASLRELQALRQRNQREDDNV